VFAAEHAALDLIVVDLKQKYEAETIHVEGSWWHMACTESCTGHEQRA